MKHNFLLMICLCALIATSAAHACPHDSAHGDHHNAHHNQHHGQHEKCQDGQCPHKRSISWSAKLQLEGEQADQVNELQKQFAARSLALKQAQQKAWQELEQEQNTALEGIISKEQFQRLHEHHGHQSTKLCPHHP